MSPANALFFENPGNLMGPKSHFEISLKKSKGCVLPLMKSFFSPFFSWKHYCTIFETFETPILKGKQNSLTGSVINGSSEKRAPGPQPGPLTPESSELPRRPPHPHPISTHLGIALIIVSNKVVEKNAGKKARLKERAGDFFFLVLLKGLWKNGWNKLKTVSLIVLIRFCTWHGGPLDPAFRSNK